MQLLTTKQEIEQFVEAYPQWKAAKGYLLNSLQLVINCRRRNTPVVIVATEQPLTEQQKESLRINGVQSEFALLMPCASGNLTYEVYVRSDDGSGAIVYCLSHLTKSSTTKLFHQSLHENYLMTCKPYLTTGAPTAHLCLVRPNTYSQDYFDAPVAVIICVATRSQAVAASNAIGRTSAKSTLSEMAEVVLPSHSMQST